jgi:23S rRNA (pseudouridine1915-N3)-methyltransferase
MKISLLNVGKTENGHLQSLIDDYCVRINRFASFQFDFILPSKNNSKLTPDEVKKSEGEMILKKLENVDCVILLDEKGKQFTSVAFAQYLQRIFNSAPKKITFVTGGAYGFSQPVYNRANEMISLSSMTTTHQLVRLVFAEQIYRAFTIIKNHPYHNE